MRLSELTLIEPTRNDPRSHRIDYVNMKRKCAGACGLELHFSHFPKSKRKNGTYGVYSYCYTCQGFKTKLASAKIRADKDPGNYVTCSCGKLQSKFLGHYKKIKRKNCLDCRGIL